MCLEHATNFWLQPLRSRKRSYLGQYSHRVAISNHRIQQIDSSGVTFLYKNYKDDSKKKCMKLSGVEFLRRFCVHILPYRFVKIRYYGIIGSKQKKHVKSLLVKKQELKTFNQKYGVIVIRICPFSPPLRLCQPS